jgi:uncharacterized membrane protein
MKTVVNSIIKKYNKSLLGGILILATSLRFSKMFWQRDFWYDEAFTGIITRMSWSEMWWMIFHDVHPPLYYYLLKLWASLFNYSLLGLRSFSVLFGLLSIFSVYWIGKRLFSEKVGLVSALLMTISPFAVQYSQEARMYALFGFISLWLTYFFVKALLTNKWKYWFGWGAISVAFLYTHYLALFTFVVFYLVALSYQFLFLKVNDKKTFIGGSWRKIFINGKFLGATGVIVIAFVLWLPVLKQHLSREGLGWVPVKYISEIPQTLQFFFYGHQPGKILEPTPNQFRNLNFSLSQEGAGNLFDGASLGLVLLLIITVGIISLWRQKKYQKEIFILSGLSFGVLIFLILLSQIGWRFYVARYFMATAVLFYLLLAVIIASWIPRWRVLFLLVYFFSLFWLKPIPYDTAWTGVYKDGDLVDNQTVVVADNAFEYATARFHFGEGRVKLYNRGEPEQDFSLWIIVKPEDQITELDDYLNNQKAIFVGAGDCNWNQYKLKPLKKVGRLQVCGKNEK